MSNEKIVYEGAMGREVAEIAGKFYAYMNDKNGQIHQGLEFARFTWAGIKSIGLPFNTQTEAEKYLNRNPWGDEPWK